MKKKTITLGVIVLIASLCCTGCLTYNASIKRSLAKIHNEPINMAAVADGTYTGHSEMGPVVVDVAVHVADHRLTQVDLVRHDCGLGHSADILPERMVARNTWDVEAVSGATVSSEIIKNAVNKALR